MEALFLALFISPSTKLLAQEASDVEVSNFKLVLSLDALHYAHQVARLIFPFLLLSQRNVQWLQELRIVRQLTLPFNFELGTEALARADC